MVYWYMVSNASTSMSLESITGLIPGLPPANERRRYKVTPSLIGWAQILGLRPANQRRRYKVTPSLIGWAQT